MVQKLPGEQKAAEVSIKALSKLKPPCTERGDAVSSTDCLAVELKEHCHSEDGFDIGKFECVLKEMTLIWNIDRETHGWIGSFV